MQHSGFSVLCLLVGLGLIVGVVAIVRAVLRSASSRDGPRFTVACPRCGERHDPAARFCRRCGSQLNA